MSKNAKLVCRLRGWRFLCAGETVRERDRFFSAIRKKALSICEAEYRTLRNGAMNHGSGLSGYIRRIERRKKK